MKRTKLNKVGKSSVSQLRRKCDKLLQENGRKKYKKCEICDKPMSCLHHFFPKSVSSRLRYEEDNLVPICSGCHLRHHSAGDPTIHAKIIDYRGQGWFDELNELKREFVKCNKGYYEEILKQLENE